MKITRLDKKEIPKKWFSINDIPDGTVFLAHIEGYDTGLYLKSYKTIVCLDKPGFIWYDREELEVYDYEEVDAELIIREKI